MLFVVFDDCCWWLPLFVDCVVCVVVCGLLSLSSFVACRSAFFVVVFVCCLLMLVVCVVCGLLSCVVVRCWLLAVGCLLLTVFCFTLFIVVEAC